MSRRRREERRKKQEMVEQALARLAAQMAPGTAQVPLMLVPPQSPSIRKQHHSPCAECPFRRGVSDESLKKGGSPPEVYIGQAWGPFLLSCHLDPVYDPNNAGLHQLQCAGAAVFRANCGRSELMPDALLRGEVDTDKVFATPAELMAHHHHLDLIEAEELLKETPPETLLQQAYVAMQTSRRAKIMAVPRESP